MRRAIEIFRGLCADLGAAELDVLRREVRAHYQGLEVAQRQTELLAIDLAGLLCERLDALLGAAGEMDPEDRAQVVGAARYFISMQDEVPDAQACTGLDDDVYVFNHVAVEIDRPDLVIDE